VLRVPTQLPVDHGWGTPTRAGKGGAGPPRRGVSEQPVKQETGARGGGGGARPGGGSRARPGEGCRGGGPEAVATATARRGGSGPTREDGSRGPAVGDTGPRLGVAWPKHRGWGAHGRVVVVSRPARRRHALKFAHVRRGEQELPVSVPIALLWGVLRGSDTLREPPREPFRGRSAPGAAPASAPVDPMAPQRPSDALGRSAVLLGAGAAEAAETAGAVGAAGSRCVRPSPRSPAPGRCVRRRRRAERPSRGWRRASPTGSGCRRPGAPSDRSACAGTCGS
jgi:hypothetical protein